MAETLLFFRPYRLRMIALTCALFAATRLLTVAATELSTESAPGKRALPAADYRIAARDLLKVELFNQPDMAAVQRVTANGDVRLALVGIVHLGGLTVREAELGLERRLTEGGFFNAPQVSISVQEFGERYVSVLGQVNDPGRVSFTPEAGSMGLLEVVASTGGFTRLARSDSVQVTTRGADGQEKIQTVNVDAMLDPKSRGTTEIRLLPGDIVFVPERVF